MLFLVVSTTLSAQTTYTGIFRSQTPYSNYHHFVRDGGGAAVYINQMNPTKSILRLSGGSESANANILFSFEGNGNMGIGTAAPSSLLHVAGDPADDASFNNRQILAYFEQSSANSSNAGIAIKSAKNNSTTTSAYLDFDIYDNNETTTNFSMARVGSGKEAGAGINGQLRFFTNDNGALTEQVRIKANGDVGIGTTSPDAKLTVKGEIHAERVIVDLNIPAPDYVFEEDYDLRSLAATASYIEANKHLPEVPSAKELEADGVDLASMDMLLLQKIEELTLYVIEQQKSIDALKHENESIKKRLNP